MDSALVLTKLRAPQADGALVTRGRLIAQLMRAVQRSHRVSLITAPAGYGKTTLASQWARQALDATRVAWLSLDTGDNSRERLARCVAAAVTASQPELATADLAQAGGSAGSPAGNAGDADCLQVALLNAITRCDGPVTLVLDDAHCITDPGAVDWLQTLVERMPEHMHVVVAGRERGGLSVGRMRAAGRLTELTLADLAFTLDESTALLNEIMGLGLSACDVALLTERTERWGAGLKLAALALQDCPLAQRSAAITQITGGHRFIRDYLGEEVFARQDEDMRCFLMQTSLLEDLRPDLCDAVTGRDDSARVLERLASCNAFVHAVDADGASASYRYHRLFAEYLSDRLRQLSGGSVSELERRAAAWRAGARVEPRDAARLSHIDRRAQARDALSERELEVMQLLAAGLSNQQIAQRICVAPGTVKRHVHNIFGKLNARSRADVIAYAHAAAQGAMNAQTRINPPMYPRAHDSVPG